VERIDPVGKPFDPQKHEAIMVQDDAEAPSNTVIEELQPGYLFKNTLLRPSKVKVAK
jgi:molecular chaperone GrpE